MLPIIGNPLVPVYTRRLTWPVQSSALAVGSPFGTTADANGIPTAFADSSATNMGLMAGAGIICGQWANLDKVTFSPASCYLPLLTGSVPALLSPSWRVWRWSMLACLQAAGTPDYRVNIALMSASTGQPLLSGNNPGFGVMGDGAGNWRYASRITGGAPGLTEVVALGIAMTAVTLFEFEIIAATATTAAGFNLFVNGVLAVSRSDWVAKLPVYNAAGGPANSARFQPTIENAGVGGELLQVAAMTHVQGQYDPSGSAVGPLG